MGPYDGEWDKAKEDLCQRLDSKSALAAYVSTLVDFAAPRLVSARSLRVLLARIHVLADLRYDSFLGPPSGDSGMSQDTVSSTGYPVVRMLSSLSKHAPQVIVTHTQY